MRYTRLWLALTCVIAVSFGLLGYSGREVYRAAPPRPDRVVSDDGRLIFSEQQVRDGQNVWQSIGGQELGSVWGHGSLSFAFWSINIGLLAMVLLSLLPIGLMQTWASVNHGMWYARSADFMQQPILQKLRWLRMVGDVCFSAGILALGWLVLGLRTGWSIAKDETNVLAGAGQRLAMARSADKQES